MINLKNKINKENTKDLEKIYEYVYHCDKCKLKYGSDREEKTTHICPICEQK